MDIEKLKETITARLKERLPDAKVGGWSNELEIQRPIDQGYPPKRSLYEVRVTINGKWYRGNSIRPVSYTWTVKKPADGKAFDKWIEKIATRYIDTQAEIKRRDTASREREERINSNEAAGERFLSSLPTHGGWIHTEPTQSDTYTFRITGDSALMRKLVEITKV